jgi:succinate dehydrogenase / fumarate reductase, cytochrome b subunit
MPSIWHSTVVRKALVAVSGLALWSWVVLHVAGNLTLFSGPGVADGYAAALRRSPGLLWAARVGLATAMVVHVAGVISLARTARAARPRHASHRPDDTSALASRGMRIGGALLLAFVVYHLLHLTVGVLHPHFEPGHVYANVVAGLHSAPIAAIYVGAALLLGLHLLHGLWAAARTLGIRPQAAARRRRPAAAVVSAAIALGFASIPLAVLVGWLR